MLIKAKKKKGERGDKNKGGRRRVSFRVGRGKERGGKKGRRKNEKIGGRGKGGRVGLSRRWRRRRNKSEKTSRFCLLPFSPPSSYSFLSARLAPFPSLSFLSLSRFSLLLTHKTFVAPTPHSAKSKHGKCIFEPLFSHKLEIVQFCSHHHPARQWPLSIFAPSREAKNRRRRRLRRVASGCCCLFSSGLRDLMSDIASFHLFPLFFSFSVGGVVGAKKGRRGNFPFFFIFFFFSVERWVVYRPRRYWSGEGWMTPLSSPSSPLDHGKLWLSVWDGTALLSASSPLGHAIKTTTVIFLSKGKKSSSSPPSTFSSKCYSTKKSIFISELFFCSLSIGEK